MAKYIVNTKIKSMSDNNKKVMIPIDFISDSNDIQKMKSLKNHHFWTLSEIQAAIESKERSPRKEKKKKKKPSKYDLY